MANHIDTDSLRRQLHDLSVSNGGGAHGARDQLIRELVARGESAKAVSALTGAPGATGYVSPNGVKAIAAAHTREGHAT